MTEDHQTRAGVMNGHPAEGGASAASDLAALVQARLDLMPAWCAEHGLAGTLGALSRGDALLQVDLGNYWDGSTVHRTGLNLYFENNQDQRRILLGNLDALLQQTWSRGLNAGLRVELEKVVLLPASRHLAAGAFAILGVDARSTPGKSRLKLWVQGPIADKDFLHSFDAQGPDLSAFTDVAGYGLIGADLLMGAEDVVLSPKRYLVLDWTETLPPAWQTLSAKARQHSSRGSTRRPGAGQWRR